MIHDAFGPAVVDVTFNALVVSRETVKGGETINRIRIENHLPALDIFVIDLVGRDTDTFKMSSTEIRRYLCCRENVGARAVEYSHSILH